MSIVQYYRINRKLLAKEKRPLVPFVFLGLGIVLIMLSYSCGPRLRRDLLKKYCDSPLRGVILAEPEDGSAINGSVVSKVSGLSGISGATGVYEFSAEIGYGRNSMPVTVWAIDRKHIADMKLKYISASEDALLSQLPLVMQSDTVKWLGESVSAGDRVSVSISGSDQVSAEIAAVADTEDRDDQLSSVLSGKVFAGMEDVASVLSILFEHDTWPGQDSVSGTSGLERMKYRYVMAFAEDPKKIEKVKETLESAGYRCITGFEGYAEQIDRNKPKAWGFLLSGSSFLLCTFYLIWQMRRQRLESNEDKINMLRDMGWRESRIKRLFFIDLNALIAVCFFVSIVMQLVIEQIL